MTDNIQSVKIASFVVIILACLTVSSSIAQDVMSPPLKQLKSGVLQQDIQCNQGLMLVINSHSLSPACISPSKSTRLLAQGWVMPDKMKTPILNTPRGYLGGYFTNHTNTILNLYGTHFDFSVPIITQSNSNGYFTFLFSKPYPQDAFSVSYQTCSRSLVSSPGSIDNQTYTGNLGNNQTMSSVDNKTQVYQICSQGKLLDHTFGVNSQGRYAVTTKNVTLPCGNVQMFDSQLLPANYSYLTFSVKSINDTVSIPFSYHYLLYAHC